MLKPTPLFLAVMAALALPLATPLAVAGGINLTVEVPKLNVAEYHRPYVAMWLERPDRSVAANLAVWYQLPKPGVVVEDRAAKNAKAAGKPAPEGGMEAGPGAQGGKQGGEKWLADMRQWWRRSGRELTMPVDGFSSATMPAGKHTLKFSEGKKPLPPLPAGNYILKVEAAREVGGREVVSIPFQWPAAKAQKLNAQGKTELGEIALELKP